MCTVGHTVFGAMAVILDVSEASWEESVVKESRNQVERVFHMGSMNSPLSVVNGGVTKDSVDCYASAVSVDSNGKGRMCIRTVGHTVFGAMAVILDVSKAP